MKTTNDVQETFWKLAGKKSASTPVVQYRCEIVRFGAVLDS